MLTRISAALVAVFLCVQSADAQVATVLSGGCGAVSYDGSPRPQTMDANGRNCVTSSSIGSANLATGQVNVGTSATLVATARAGRNKIKVTMLGAVDAYCGAAGVTSATGDLLLGTKGASVTIETAGAVYCVAASTVAVSFMETYP